MMTLAEFRRLTEGLPPDAFIILCNAQGDRYSHVQGGGLGHAHDVERPSVAGNQVYNPVVFADEAECDEHGLMVNCVCVGP